MLQSDTQKLTTSLKKRFGTLTEIQKYRVREAFMKNNECSRETFYRKLRGKGRVKFYEAVEISTLITKQGK